jgi:hypothetical protein
MGSESSLLGNVMLSLEELGGIFGRVLKPDNGFRGGFFLGIIHSDTQKKPVRD